MACPARGAPAKNTGSSQVDPAGSVRIAEAAMELEVRHLRLVTEIAASGSMTRAAERLYLTQSALSHQLRDIEARFKTQFFVRLGRRMVLTPAGERVLASARRVLVDLEQTEEDLRCLADGGHGVIRVCTQCNTGYHWLAPLLTTFGRRFPRVVVNVLADATDRPVQALLEGRLDLAILVGSPRDRRLRLRPLFMDEMVAIVAADHPLAGRTWLSPRMLAQEHLLIYSSAPEDSFVLTRILEAGGLEPARVSFIMLTEAMTELARAGVGVGVLPRWSAQRVIAAGTVRALSIGRRGVHRQWTAATLAAREEPDYLAAFIDLVAERAGPTRLASTRARASA
jgi:LysR family transcriptional regulator for metE and metH